MGLRARIHCKPEHSYHTAFMRLTFFFFFFSECVVTMPATCTRTSFASGMANRTRTQWYSRQDSSNGPRLTSSSSPQRPGEEG